MIVNIHESSNKTNKYAFCYSLTDDVLQVQEEILKQLNAERNQDIPNFQFYYDEMEKIHDNTYNGGSNTISSESLEVDNFFGSLGVAAEANYNIQEQGRRYDGIC